MNKQLAWGVGLVALVALPFLYRDPYHLHILVLILIWSFAYTSWSMMGRFGLVSLGHGGFMGVGAYVTALLWNHLGISPWIGIPAAMLCAGALALVVAYPCFRFRITGHYFALVTLALSGIVLQVIIATRDYTGGSLGYTPERTKGSHILALQFDDKVVWYLIALGVWAGGLAVWYWIDRSMSRYAMEAISRGRGRGSGGRRQRHGREAAHHRDQCRHDGDGGGAVRPVPDVHLPRHGERHRGLAADGVRGRRGRDLRRPGADGGRHHHDPPRRGPAHRLRHQRRLAGTIWSTASCWSCSSSSYRRASSAACSPC
jgi:hypothetical protein